jgi:hypothetical protein
MPLLQAFPLFCVLCVPCGGISPRSPQVRQKSPVQPRKRPPPQHYRSYRSRRLCIPNSNKPATRSLFDRHFWHNRYPHASPNHAQYAAELPALKHNLRMQPRPVASRHGRIAKTVTIAQQKESFRAKLLQRKRTSLRILVLPRQRRKQMLREQRKRLELVSANGQRQNGHVHHARAQPLQQHRRDLFQHRNSRLRKSPRQKRQLRRQKVRRDRRNHANANRSSHRLLPLHHVSARRLQLPQDRSRSRQKRFPQVRKPHRPPQPVKQPRPQLILQLKNLLRQGRLRNVRLLRRSAKRSAIRHRAKISKLM